MILQRQYPDSLGPDLGPTPAVSFLSLSNTSTRVNLGSDRVSHGVEFRDRFIEAVFMEPQHQTSLPIIHGLEKKTMA
jgi:hypothetical protein